LGCGHICEKQAARQHQKPANSAVFHIFKVDLSISPDPWSSLHGVNAEPLIEVRRKTNRGLQKKFDFGKNLRLKHRNGSFQSFGA